MVWPERGPRQVINGDGESGGFSGPWKSRAPKDRAFAVSRDSLFEFRFMQNPFPSSSEHLRSASSFSSSIFNGESQGIIQQSSPSLDASGSMLLSAVMLTGVEFVTLVRSRTASINDDEAAIRNKQSLLSSRRLLVYDLAADSLLFSFLAGPCADL